MLFLDRQDRDRGRAYPGGGAGNPGPAGELLLIRNGIAQQPFAQPVSEAAFLAGGAHQPADGPGVTRPADGIGWQQGHQTGDPGALIDARLGGPTAVPALRRREPAQPAPGPLRLARIQQSHDGIHGRLRTRFSANVGPTAVRVLSADENFNRHAEMIIVRRAGVAAWTAA